MVKIQVCYDHTGNTLTIWFGNPQDEYIAEETGEEVTWMKDKTGQVIGFEKLNFTLQDSSDVRIAFDTVTA